MTALYLLTMLVIEIIAPERLKAFEQNGKMFLAIGVLFACMITDGLALASRRKS